MLMIINCHLFLKKSLCAPKISTPIIMDALAALLEAGIKKVYAVNEGYAPCPYFSCK